MASSYWGRPRDSASKSTKRSLPSSSQIHPGAKAASRFPGVTAPGATSCRPLPERFRGGRGRSYSPVEWVTVGSDVEHLDAAAQHFRHVNLFPTPSGEHEI